MWCFLTNTNNSAALQAIGSILSVVVAALTVIVTIILTRTSVEISKRQKEISEELIRKQDRENEELKKKVSAAIQYKLIQIENALIEIRSRSNPKTFCEMSLEIEISEEMIIKSYDTTMYHRIISFWNEILAFRRDYSENMDPHHLHLHRYNYNNGFNMPMTQASYLVQRSEELREELRKIFDINQAGT
ncbi:hypothetical protein SD70_02425 [Gordoniibacillus kamchatkensis]|uniref:DUF4760 domain-containing protein n=1 Tax=Gordoniibacillus kamchatkensis TaxID=1590651 RepID=A0ABR5ALZ9_9BACL|nr:hypothetical protein [Paenibacillus sp. VKM B-2647]KIL42060.1 hypothetical protein SD70_02425 [Paenibacillus sp. VKM B-2647]